MTVEDIRRSLGISQERFAEQIGISKRAYTNKIAGRTEFTVRELAKIAEISDFEISSGSSILHCSIAHNVCDCDFLEEKQAMK